jgi:ketosteroid isomerase-like protein
MTLIDKVRELIEAENNADVKKAEAILAPDFVAITRRNGDEEGRTELLRRIGAAPTSNPLRETGEFHVWESYDIGVVRSVVQTKDRTTHAVLGQFRNLHVFRKQQDGWVCVNWQVTELKNREAATRDRITEDQLYEDGKHRRYSLMFAVNGGAFAVARLLTGSGETPALVVGSLRLEQLAVGMALFTTIMAIDIDAFGRRMKEKDRDLYKGIGVFVLLAIGSLTVAGWMLAAYRPASAGLAIVAHVAIVLGCHFVLPRLEKRSSG